jgi:hypothetical protein
MTRLIFRPRAQLFRCGSYINFEHLRAGAKRSQKNQFSDGKKDNLSI